MVVHIDISRLSDKPWQLGQLDVFLPSHAFKRMDEYAAEQHMTRSALILKATEQLLVSQSSGQQDSERWHG